MKKLKILIPFLVILLLFYGFGVFWYSSHFPHGTTINGKNVSGTNPTEAAVILQEDPEKRDLTLVEKDGEETISANQIHLTVNFTRDAKNLQKKASPLLWIGTMIHPHHYKASGDVSFDADAFQGAFEKLACLKNDTKPKDAYIKQGETQFEIVPEKEGNVVKAKELSVAIQTALQKGKTRLNLESADLYETPKITSKTKKLTRAVRSANKIAASSVIYPMKTEEDNNVVLDYSEFKNWILIDDEYHVYLDSRKVHTYAKNLKKKYDTLGKKMSFTTRRGNEISLSNPDYGFSIDTEKESQALLKNLTSGEETKRDPEYSHKAFASIADGIGDTYLEVSLAEQHAWIVSHGEVKQDSNITTGDSETPTKTGLFMVVSKKSPATLDSPDNAEEVEEEEETESDTSEDPFYNIEESTETDDVTESTEETIPTVTDTKSVTYEVSYGDGIICDAPWRTTFGVRGSNGNINCPKDFAQAVYQFSTENMPIVIHE